MFQSTYLYKVRPSAHFSRLRGSQFQSTYLYKVRLDIINFSIHSHKFQSTYLYKVRLASTSSDRAEDTSFNPRTYIRYDVLRMPKRRRSNSFNPRTYIRYDTGAGVCFFLNVSFNPRTYIRYDSGDIFFCLFVYGFNPRTYIRYDCITNNANIYSLLSMHLCDNKLFGFFIDEIKLIGVFNRLIINDCENSSFLLMLNVRKQLYYKFIFYIIGCDDTYVFNSFRIIISQEIETNTIFFMIDDIR